ncbi:P-loop containing nucleoside triphosphate hydrolase protein, partial [Auricularia subglabra TFB-10046 SS5]
LKGVSFKIDRGQLVVIVGTNGSGKSTIIKLLSRLCDPDEGRILVNGVDIRTIRLDELRARLAVLFQDFAFFALTIRENIALGDPDNAHALDIDDAAKRAGIDFMDKFDKYLEVRPPIAPAAQTTGLSGGQKQKVAVARALLRANGARVLVLDEPSAALDSVAESSLFAKLRGISEDKTVIVCSHRFGDLTRLADVIVHIDSGRVVEQGTHQELLATEGSSYAKLWGMQAEAFATPTA